MATTPRGIEAAKSLDVAHHRLAKLPRAAVNLFHDSDDEVAGSFGRLRTVSLLVIAIDREDNADAATDEQKGEGEGEADTTGEDVATGEMLEDPEAVERDRAFGEQLCSIAQSVAAHGGDLVSVSPSLAVVMFPAPMGPADSAARCASCGLQILREVHGHHGVTIRAALGIGEMTGVLLAGSNTLSHLTPGKELFPQLTQAIVRTPADDSDAKKIRWGYAELGDLHSATGALLKNTLNAKTGALLLDESCAWLIRDDEVDTSGGNQITDGKMRRLTKLEDEPERRPLAPPDPSELADDGLLGALGRVMGVVEGGSAVHGAAGSSAPPSPKTQRKLAWARPGGPAAASRGRAVIISVELSIAAGGDSNDGGGDLRSLLAPAPAADASLSTATSEVLAAATNERMQRVVERLGAALAALDTEAGRYYGSVYNFLGSDPLRTEPLSSGINVASADIVFFEQSEAQEGDAASPDGEAGGPQQELCHQALRAACAILTRIQTIDAVDITMGLALGPILWFEASDGGGLRRIPVALGTPVLLASRMCRLASSLGLPCLADGSVYAATTDPLMSRSLSRLPAVRFHGGRHAMDAYMVTQREVSMGDSSVDDASSRSGASRPKFDREDSVSSIGTLALSASGTSTVSSDQMAAFDLPVGDKTEEQFENWVGSIGDKMDDWMRKMAADAGSENGFNFDQLAINKFTRARAKQSVANAKLIRKYGKREPGPTLQVGTGGSSSAETENAVRKSLLEAASKMSNDREMELVILYYSVTHEADAVKDALVKFLPADCPMFATSTFGMIMLEDRMVSSMVDGNATNPMEAAAIGCICFSFGVRKGLATATRAAGASSNPGAPVAETAGGGIDKSQHVKDWLSGINPSLAMYADKMVEAGADNVGMLLDIDDDDREELLSECQSTPNAKKLHIKKIEKALIELKTVSEQAESANGASAAGAEPEGGAPVLPRGSAGVGSGAVDYGPGFGVNLVLTTTDVFDPPREPIYAATRAAIKDAIKAAGHEDDDRDPDFLVLSGLFMPMDQHMVDAVRGYFGDKGCPPIIGGTSADGFFRMDAKIMSIVNGEVCANTIAVVAIYLDETMQGGVEDSVMPNFLGSVRDAVVTSCAGDYIMELDTVNAAEEYGTWTGDGMAQGKQMIEEMGGFATWALQSPSVLLNTIGTRVGYNDDDEEILVPRGPLALSKAGGLLPCFKIPPGSEVKQVTANRRALIARSLKKIKQMNKKLAGHAGGLFVFCGTYPQLVPDKVSTLHSQIASTFAHPQTPFLGVMAAGEQGRFWVKPTRDEDSDDDVAGGGAAGDPERGSDPGDEDGDPDDDADGSDDGHGSDTQLQPVPMAGMMLGVALTFGTRHSAGGAANAADGDGAQQGAPGAAQRKPSMLGTGGAPQTQWKLKGRHAAFLSHFKRECAMEARYFQSNLADLLGCDVFLDSDDLTDLRKLLQHVKESDVLLLFQTKGLFTRPWCLLEVYTAVEAMVPIVTVNVKGFHPYDFEDALRCLTFLDTELEKRNPGASKLLADHGVDVVDCAHKLSSVVPNIISVDFNPSGSRNNIMACLLDVVDSMQRAVPAEVTTTREEFLAKRGSPDDDA